MPNETNQKIEAEVRSVIDRVILEVESVLMREDVALGQSIHTTEGTEQIDVSEQDVTEAVEDYVDSCSMDMNISSTPSPSSITEESYICTRSMMRNIVSEETQTETNRSNLVIAPESARYGITMTALRDIKNKNKMNISDLDQYIKDKFKYIVPNLRKNLNAGIKNGIVEKSTGDKGRVLYEIKENDAPKREPSSSTEEGTSQLDLTYKKTDSETYFRVSQTRKPRTQKKKTEKQLVLEAIADSKNTQGITAINIRNIVNKKKSMNLKRVQELLNMCIEDKEVQMIKTGKVVRFKLIQ